jgi:predicted Fe-Mo cluster-binding NifX family protein
MIQARIAIPSTLPGGLEAAVGEHFGHCDLYTVVDVTEGKVAQVGILPNVPHEQGGCLGPVNHLARHGVTVLIAGGMGMRPLMGFNEVGIEVFRGTKATNVEAAVKSFLEGGLERFTQDHTCGGGGGHHH